MPLPDKEGDIARPLGQLGFVCPGGREWSVLVSRPPIAGPDAGYGPIQQLWLTLADREDGKTRRIGGQPFVQQRHELSIDPANLTGDIDLMAMIENAVVDYWNAIRHILETASDLERDMKALGLDDAPDVFATPAPIIEQPAAIALPGVLA